MPNKTKEDLQSLSKEALVDYKGLKKRKNVVMEGVPWWIISKDLRGGYKKPKESIHGKFVDDRRK